MIVDHANELFSMSFENFYVFVAFFRLFHSHFYFDEWKFSSKNWQTKWRGFSDAKAKERKKRKLKMIYDGWWATSLIHSWKISKYHGISRELKLNGVKAILEIPSTLLFPTFSAKRWWIRNFQFPFIIFPSAEKPWIIVKMLMGDFFEYNKKQQTTKTRPTY